MNKLTLPMTALGTNRNEEDRELDLFAVFGTLWRGKLWILLSTIIVIFIGGFYAFKIAESKYPALSLVALQTKQQQVVDIESVLSGVGGGSEEVNTEVEIIRSRNLVAAVVERLELVQDPEFNGTLTEHNPYHPIVILKSLLRITNPEPTETEILNSVIDNTIAVISVTNIRKSLVFSIVVTTGDPVKSALIANTLADLYVQNSLDEKFNATETASAWLSKKAAELKLELEVSEINVKDFSDSTQLISADSLSGLSIQLKEMRDRIADLDNKRSVLDNRFNTFENAINSSNMDAILASADNQALNQFASELKSGTISQATFDQQVILIRDQMRVEALRANQQYESMLSAEASFKVEIDGQSSDLVQLQQLQRESEANKLLYESFLSRLKETAVQQGLQQPDSRIISQAVPRHASAPRKGRILILSAFFGFLIGAGIVFLRELRNNTFRTPDDLELFTGYGVLGSIPRAKKSTRKDVLSYAKDKPTSIFAEAIRNLRTSVLLSDVDNPPQVIMSTSSVPGEGKTTTSLTLAQNMAGLGKKVLVLEGDIRKRIFAEYFDIENSNGFMAVMSDESTLESTVFKPNGMNIDVLIGEKSSINAADIFASTKFANLMKILRANYDYIIIDTAPVLAVPDARVIGQHADAILYSVLWNSTTKTQVKQGLSMFETVGLRVSGLVLGNVNSKEMKRYGYAGQYGYAYGDSDGYHDG